MLVILAGWGLAAILNFLPSSTIAGALWLAVLACMVVGLFLMIRGDRRRRLERHKVDE